jgi:D-beta-D-heptose 7-phosphate kinase/D-beta-D-heptose 1-phosphate adenosyltransferase
LPADLCSKIVQQANDAHVPVYIDPKGNDWNKYNGAYIITPNMKEIQDLLGRPVSNTDHEIAQAGQMILKQYNFEFILITRSEKGMSLISRNRAKHFPTRAREVFDVSGAGDTVIATLAWAMSEGQSLDESIHVANVAAGIVVSKLGTTPIDHDELQRALHASDEKILPLPHLLKQLKSYKDSGKKVVFTNGCFDILHRGHVQYLREARALGDILVVGLNADTSVKRLKGETRPINNELDRAEVLAGLESVDHVVLFHEDTPAELLSSIRPDILVKGGDYIVADVAGREFAGAVAIVPFVEGFSTTKTIKKMKDGKP